MKRIFWKRGMRLTDSILRASDESMAEMVAQAFVLASAGRFGLLPSQSPFELSVNIGKGFLDVESLSCLATTRGGDLIDAHYDTRYNNNFNTRVAIPDTPGVEEYILTINVIPDSWKEIPNGFEEPEYTFALISPETMVPDNALPIGRIVEDRGWRMDDVDFVPPCLFISSHRKYGDLLQRFNDLLAAIDTKISSSNVSGAMGAIRTFWPFIQQLRIAADKECDLMTPMSLLSNVQKCVSAFTCACDLDEGIELEDIKMFRGYIHAPYNYKDAYQRIQVGLQLCYSIGEKVDKLTSQAQPRQEARPAGPLKPADPVIASDQLFQDCKDLQVSIPVAYDNPSAIIYFTIDGSQPNARSKKAAKTRKGYIVQLENGFNLKGSEPDKTITLSLMAVVNGNNSNVRTYDIVLHKNMNIGEWGGFKI